MALCQETNTCLHKFSPCNGSCSSSYPRLMYCEATGSCVNIATACGGTCLASNRFKCFSEDKCVHKNKLNDGKFDCSGKTTNYLIFSQCILFLILICYDVADKSDEDIQDDEDIRKAIYQLLKLNNLTRF